MVTWVPGKQALYRLGHEVGSGVTKDIKALTAIE